METIFYYILGIYGMVVFCSNGKYKADCVEGGLQKKKMYEKEWDMYHIKYSGRIWIFTKDFH